MKIKNLLAMLVLSIFFSFSVSAGDYINKFKESTETNYGNGNHGGGNGNHHGGGTVGAPLDGGLLTILGAAGVAYFVARKKKKNGEVL